MRLYGRACRLAENEAAYAWGWARLTHPEALADSAAVGGCPWPRLSETFRVETYSNRIPPIADRGGLPNMFERTRLGSINWFLKETKPDHIALMPFSLDP